jgi:hypothetical protein
MAIIVWIAAFLLLIHLLLQKAGVYDAIYLSAQTKGSMEATETEGTRGPRSPRTGDVLINTDATSAREESAAMDIAYLLDIRSERDNYYEKLRDIEAYLMNLENKSVNDEVSSVSASIRNILHAKTECFKPEPDFLDEGKPVHLNTLSICASGERSTWSSRAGTPGGPTPMSPIPPRQ